MREIKSTLESLCKLMEESGVKISFDPYRDITKGCSDSCFGMNKEANGLCDNHLEAIKRGDWFFKGGEVSKWFSEFQEEILILQVNNEALKREVRGVERQLELTKRHLQDMCVLEEKYVIELHSAKKLISKLELENSILRARNSDAEYIIETLNKKLKDVTCEQV